MYKKINDFLSKHFIIILILVALVLLSLPGSGRHNFARKGNFYNKYGNKELSMRDENQPMMMKSLMAPSPMGMKTGTGMGMMKGAYNDKVVKNASLEIEVSNMQNVKDEVTSLVAKYKGFITNFNSYEVNPSEMAYNFTIKVPADKLDNLSTEIAKLGIKKSDNFNVADITEQYQDTANQLKNLEARRDRLRKLLESDTKDLKDILEVDKELNSVQNQIERLTRTQNKRDADVAYSTLNLSVVPKLRVEDFTSNKWSFSNSLKQSVNNLIYFTQKFTDAVVKIVVFIPFWGGAIVILVLGRLLYRKLNGLGEKKSKKTGKK